MGTAIGISADKGLELLSGGAPGYIAMLVIWDRRNDPKRARRILCGMTRPIMIYENVILMFIFKLTWCATIVTLKFNFIWRKRPCQLKIHV